MASTPSPGRVRGGRGRGRGRGRGPNGNNKAKSPKAKPGNGHKTTDDSSINASADNNNTSAAPTSNINTANSEPELTDQQILIAFGPYVRSGHPDALKIHQVYLNTHDQALFLGSARRFLVQQKSVEAQAGLSDAASIGTSDASAATGIQLGSAGASSVINTSPSVDVSAVQNIAAQISSVQIDTSAARITEQMNIPFDSKPRVSGPPPGILPPPGLTQTPVEPAPPATVPQSTPEHLTVVPNTVNSASSSQPSTSNNNAQPSILPAPIKSPKEESKSEQAPTAPAKVKIRRTQTRLVEQPGKLFANGVAAPPTPNNPSSNNQLTVRLRTELTARWVLPLKHLRERVLRRQQETGNSTSTSTQSLTIRDALAHLTVGLFRYGVADNGAHCSIVSKTILATDTDATKNGKKEPDYPFDVDQATDCIYGTVPFYSPRTPGNVVFRLYFEDEAHITLATGPMIKVVVQDDYASVLRFILSNFKSKKTNGMSSIHSFGMVLEMFDVNTQSNGLEEAGRAGWGCICETRKLVEGAAVSYLKKKGELDVLERELVEAEGVKKDLLKMAEEHVVVAKKEEDGEKEGGVSEEKQKLMGDRYTNERKWKEMQLAYASLLESILKNESSRYLFKKDMMQKMCLEYELWCPLCESFAPNPLVIGDMTQPSSTILVQSFNRNWSVKSFEESRQTMQKELLGYIPIKASLQSITAGRAKSKDMLMDLSNAMKALYMDEYRVSDDVHARREAVRSGIEEIVTASAAFPEGTRVAVFGSSANGFGSPSSDLDLCLQIPQSATDFTKEHGVSAMTQLAEKFTEAGMVDVDTVRLTARIPIVKLNFPYDKDGKSILVECDLSLQNPLACLNTALLNTYSKISPDTCILASIIKRWAKMRDINNPAMHTLSSYGYVLMLLFYLTSSEPNDGFVVDPGNVRGKNPPLLVNLQRVDPSWAQNPVGPYREILAKPHNQYCIHQHPTEPNYMVNTYFYRSGLEILEQYHVNRSKGGPCLGVVLASFFRYFAYEFDYKKLVVSLDTKHGEFKEKETKAEEDGWSLYKPGLAIEDPFEHFYDVAHVVKTSNFHHIQQEFALAYSKIASATSGDRGFVTGRDLIDLICEPVAKDD